MGFHSATLVGVQPIPVEIEIDLSEGLHFFQIVGLPDTIVKESKTRVKSAILQSGYDFPYDRRVVLNLAPSNVKKAGTGFELGMAVRILATSGQIPCPEFNVLFLGELALDGTVRSVPDTEALSYAAHGEYARGQKFQMVVVNKSDLLKVAHLGIPTLAINHLKDLKGKPWWNEATVLAPKAEADSRHSGPHDLYKVKFSSFWARHLLVAALGRHHYFVMGPPGCGKTFFAENLHKLLSETCGKATPQRRLLNVIFGRHPNEYPWSSPHHSATVAGLIGGGKPPQPGAATRAHGGLLFMDELFEFSRESLDAFREPLEKKKVEIYRAGHYFSFPTDFQLLAAANPCRCGKTKGIYGRCFCLPRAKKQYQEKMSGPLLDRFDVKLEVSNDGSENTVTGAQIIEVAKTCFDYKLSMRNPAWSPRALAFVEHESSRLRINYRAQGQIRSLSETLAVIDRKEVSIENVKEALILNLKGRFKTGEVFKPGD